MKLVATKSILVILVLISDNIVLTQDNITAQNDDENDIFSDLTTSFTLVPTAGPITSTTTAEIVGEQHDCVGFELSADQPKYDKNAFIKKCCPLGQKYVTRDEKRICADTDNPLNITPLFIKFYGEHSCISDTENEIHFEVEHSRICDKREKSVYVDGEDESLFIIQNGDLLVIQNDGSTFDIFDTFCVELDDSLGGLIALECADDVLDVIEGRTYILAFGMILPAIGLIVTSIAYATVPPLNNMFGKLVSFFSFFFLIGLALRTFAICSTCFTQSVQIYILRLSDFSYMSSIYIFLLMNIYNLSYAAYYLQNYLEFDTKNKEDLIGSVLFGYILAVVPTALPFDRTYTFYTPMFITSFISAVVVFGTYYFLKALVSIRRTVISVNKNTVGKEEYDPFTRTMPKFDVDRFETVKSMTQYCVIQLVIGISIRCCLVIIKHLKQHNDFHDIIATYLLYFHAISIFVVFVCWRQQWHIIREWWFNSGSLVLTDVEQPTSTEMQPLSKNNCD